jgi:hypothetical protein
MSERRVEKKDACPLDGAPVALAVCQSCRFFRGAAYASPNPPSVVCNWPRSGSYIDPALPHPKSVQQETP